MICKKCQAQKEQGKRCGECHKRRCRSWHERFVKAGVPKVLEVNLAPVEIALVTKITPALKPRKVSVAEQKRLDKNARERARRARLKVAAARK